MSGRRSEPRLRLSNLLPLTSTVYRLPSTVPLTNLYLLTSPLVPPWWPLLLEDLQRNNFADLAGAHATAHVPLADRLVGAVVNASLPPDGAIRALELKAHSGNEFTVRVRLRKPALLPPLSLRFRIAHQPELPASPLLVLLLAPTGLGVLAGPALRMLGVGSTDSRSTTGEPSTTRCGPSRSTDETRS